MAFPQNNFLYEVSCNVYLSMISRVPRIRKAGGRCVMRCIILDLAGELEGALPVVAGAKSSSSSTSLSKHCFRLLLSISVFPDFV